MRKLLGILLFFLIATGIAVTSLPGVKGDALRAELANRYAGNGIGGISLAISDGVIAALLHERWIELRALAAGQIASELATVQKLKTGEIKLGAPAAGAPSPVNHTIEKAKEKPRPPVSRRASRVPPPAPVAAIVQPAAAPVIAIIPPMAAPAAGNTFVAPVSRQDRGPIPPPDPFWTEERMQEALKNDRTRPEKD